MQISCIPDHFRILDRAALKWIALISMLIDHTALVVLFYGILCGSNTFATTYSDALYGLYRLMRSVGRIAFPLFLFMLVQGFKYTHDRKSYGRHLLIFALLSEIPFNLTVGQSLLSLGYQNVMWTLLLGFLMMCALEKLEQATLQPLLRAVLYLLVIAATALIACLCKTDYSYKGILALALMYIFPLRPQPDPPRYRRSLLLGARRPLRHSAPGPVQRPERPRSQEPLLLVLPRTSSGSLCHRTAAPPPVLLTNTQDRS